MQLQLYTDWSGYDTFSIVFPSEKKICYGKLQYISGAFEGEWYVVMLAMQLAVKCFGWTNFVASTDNIGVVSYFMGQGQWSYNEERAFCKRYKKDFGVSVEWYPRYNYYIDIADTYAKKVGLGYLGCDLVDIKKSDILSEKVDKTLVGWSDFED